MVEAMVNGQLAYAGTSDLSEQGLREAARRASRLARVSAPFKTMHFSEKHRPKARGRFISQHLEGLDTQTLGEFTDQLVTASRHLKVSDKIVNTSAETTLMETWLRYVSSNGADIDERFLRVSNNFAVTAQDGTESQRRSMNGPVARCRQALELLAADNCPDETLDLVLAPDQMLLQIHESIGHPLELDRILGDERNYAGWSFVKPEDFGHLQYGSKLMNATFDPTVAGEFASYAFDDCGHPATYEYLIKDGILLRGLGSLESQSRLGLPGVANFRSAGWNSAPIDRIANINLEPGDSSMANMLASVERGVYMESNISWSIDDYRNKFQFGCEYARLIENGHLTKVLKNPNYRGVTVPFWNSLTGVGHRETVEVLGSRYWGKGEPNQMIHVGHASPPCLFSRVEVFGGGK